MEVEECLYYHLGALVQVCTLSSTTYERHNLLQIATPSNPSLFPT